MATVTITSNTAEVAAKLRAVGQSMPDAIAPASLRIADTVRNEIGLRYGPVAKYWAYDIATYEVRVWGDHPHLIWWEFGTKPHGINPVQARVLRFTPRGASEAVFAAHVNHPGTRAHNQRTSVLNVLGYSAAFEWRAAIDDLLRTL